MIYDSEHTYLHMDDWLIIDVDSDIAWLISKLVDVDLFGHPTRNKI